MNMITSLVRLPSASWWIIFAGISAAMHVGKLAPAIQVFSNSFGVSLIESGFLLSTVQLVGMAFGLLVGLNVEGWGLRRSMFAGLLILSVASILGSSFEDFRVLLMLRVVEGFGFLCVCMPAPSMLIRLVRTGDLPVMLGLWGCYMPFGVGAALLLGPWIIDVSSWEIWWAGIGLISLVAAYGVWNNTAVDLNLSSKVSIKSKIGNTLYKTLSQSGPWFVAISFALYSGQWLAVIGFLPFLYLQSGSFGLWVGPLTALVAAINMVGNAASGAFLKRGFKAQTLLMWAFGTMATATFFAFGSYPNLTSYPGVRYFSILIFSAVGGVIPGTLFFMAVQLAPSEDTVATTVGWAQQWSSMGQFLGPPLVAWVATSQGGWQWTWWITGLMGIMGIYMARKIGDLVALKGAKGN